MYLPAVSRALKGRGCNFGTTLYGIFGAVSSRPAPPGFFMWQACKQASSLPALDCPLADIPHPPTLPDFLEPAKIQSKVLENGVTIVSQASPTPTASIGLFIDSGSVYETPVSRGASHLLERMAFKSTRNRSHLRVVREVQGTGGVVEASASREQMGYTFDALKTYVPEMVELLIDCVRNPAFLDWEVNEELKVMKHELEELKNNPVHLLLEEIQRVGFSGALGNPLWAPESALNGLSSAILEDFVAEHYTAPRMVLAAVGAEFEELLSVAEPLLSDLPQVPRSEKPKSTYAGGDYRHQDKSPMAHVALAFQAPGGWRKEKQAITLNVLKMLMGSCDSLSVGLPGNGMHSRLYLRLGDSNEHPQLQSFSAFNSLFNNTGLFGIYFITTPDFVQKAIDIAAQELLTIAEPGKVSESQLSLAKEATKSAVLMNLESRRAVAETIGSQYLIYGERKSVELFLKALDQITLKDINALAQKIISSRLTMASYGNVSNVPSYESVSSKFNAQ